MRREFVTEDRSWQVAGRVSVPLCTETLCAKRRASGAGPRIVLDYMLQLGATDARSRCAASPGLRLRVHAPCSRRRTMPAPEGVRASAGPSILPVISLCYRRSDAVDLCRHRTFMLWRWQLTHSGTRRRAGGSRSDTRGRLAVDGRHCACGSRTSVRGCGSVRQDERVRLRRRLRRASAGSGGGCR
jgi:hypothetical protein